ncbi:MAG: hypothetical protein U0325_23395 [Polyangiales bacterium]
MRTRERIVGWMLAGCVAGCGIVVEGTTGDAAVRDGGGLADVSLPADVSVPAESAACDAVRAACGTAPQTFVRGHASGLAVPDGATARFAIRYVPTADASLSDARGVVVATARVRGGAFEACVCVPRAANGYPQVAAVVLAPGAAGRGAGDVLRGMVSQRYATLGDEEVGSALAMAPTRGQAEAALAAMDERALRRAVALPDVDGGANVLAGVVSPERPVAAQVVATNVREGRAAWTWNMPGRATPDERVALLVVRNRDRRCDTGDLAFWAPLGREGDLLTPTAATGPMMGAVCAALALDDPREP